MLGGSGGPGGTFPGVGRVVFFWTKMPDVGENPGPDLIPKP